MTKKGVVTILTNLSAIAGQIRSSIEYDPLVDEVVIKKKWLEFVADRLGESVIYLTNEVFTEEAHSQLVQEGDKKGTFLSCS